MKPISISQVKSIREMLGATHVVIFAADGEEQHVATHGATEVQARQAAQAGNKLKAALGWPENLCRDTPLERKCANCTFYKADYGTFCVNGWSDDGSRGYCLFQPGKIPTQAESKCHNFEPKY